MASRPHKVNLHVKPRYAPYVSSRSLAAVARRTLAAERVSPPGALSVVITDDRSVRVLNRRYRRTDAPTDVLSFTLDPSPGFVLPKRHRRDLGEIVISYATAARQARAARRAVHDELAHLLVHGILHMLGYDHERARDEKRMRAREDALLG